MKVGCCAWAFTAPKYSSPYEDAIDAIGGLGFDGIELITGSEEHLNEYYTDGRVRDLRERIRARGLILSEFVAADPVTGDLASLDPARKEKALALFERAAVVAEGFGTDTINIVAAWPPGLSGPEPGVSRAIYTEERGQEKFSPKFVLEFSPEDFDWAAIWENYVDSMRRCAEIASRHGLRLAIEGHTHVVLSHTDSFLRLFDRVEDPALGTNFDTTWQFMQREYLPASIYKLGGKVFHVHAVDSDGLAAYFMPPGQGIVDWDGVLDALHGVGYDGFLSVELGRYRDPARWVDADRRYLERVIADHGYGG